MKAKTAQDLLDKCLKIDSEDFNNKLTEAVLNGTGMYISSVNGEPIHRSAIIKCDACNGIGFIPNLNNEPVKCRKCNGRRTE